jgi:hypothetical protein
MPLSEIPTIHTTSSAADTHSYFVVFLIIGHREQHTIYIANNNLWRNLESLEFGDECKAER